MKIPAIPALTITLILLLSSMPTLLGVAEEPSLQQWFNDNSYIIDVTTNKTSISAFPPGYYRATIMAEFAMYAPNNTFGWYSISTGTLHQLFTGPDTTAATADFSPTELFGFYLGSPEGTFYTEKSRNVDAINHTWTFQDPKTDGGCILSWEDLLTGGDKDYQDMIVAMRTVRLPHAFFNWSPQNPLVNQTVTFNASDSTAGEGNITSYLWNFGDSNTTTTIAPIVTHAYSAFGNYTAILNVTNNEGKGDSVSHTLTVVTPPHAEFTYSPATPELNETITFDASASTPDGGTIASYNWNFGDSNTTTTSTPIITHAYHAYGNYTVTLNITDTEQKSDSVSHTVTVVAHPHAAFTYSPPHPQVNETVTFNASASTPDGGTIVNYGWNFGDSNTTTVSNSTVTHIYATYGNYTVTLNITDTEQKSDSVSHTVTVIGPPHAAFAHSPTVPEVNETITFDASASTPDGGTIASYNWNFGDGNTSTASTPTATHAYRAYGNYTVTLNITDTEQKSDSVSRIIKIVARPNAAFTYSPPIPKANETITFNASASTPDGGAIVSYQWNFSDGSPSGFGVTVTHYYTAPGNYTVTLNVTDSEGKWDTESKTVTVQKPPPEPEFDVKIEDEWTLPGDEYVFTSPVYGKTFKVEVRITNATDVYGYEFWLEFDPTLIQLTQHEALHIHTEDLIALEEVDNATGRYKQAITAKAPAQPFNGSAPIANIWFRIIRDPCYPYNFTSILKLNNTKMTNQNGLAIENLQKHGYFKMLSVRPEITIEHDGKTELTNWIENNTFTIDVNLTDIIRMRGFYIEIKWGDCLETDIQNVAITNFLPPPYEVYEVNVSDTGLIIQVKTFLEKPAINGTGTITRITFKAKNPWGGTPHYTRIGDKYVPDNRTCKIEIVKGWIDVYCPEYRKMDFYNSSYGVNVKDKFTYTFTPIPGDLNLDGEVNIVDLSTISHWMGFQTGDPEWPECYRLDLNGDGSIDVFDVVIVSSNMGRTHP